MTVFLGIGASAGAGLSRDWSDWHRAYDRPGSFLALRLAVVQMRIREWLARAPAGPLRVVSLCAGEGRDLLGALAGHVRAGDVRARLVERDARNAAAARAAAALSGLAGVDVVEADAGVTEVWQGAVPADLVLACGVFGNVSDSDIEATVAALPSLCAPGATVIWTRHRAAPDRTPDVRRWLAAAGFEEIAFDAPDELLFSVGTHRLVGPPAPLAPGRRLFTFVGFDALYGTQRAGP